MRLRPLSPFGVELLDVDLRHDQPDAVRRAVADAWIEHHVVVVRGQQLEVDDQVRFAGWLGTVRPPDPIVHPDATDEDTHTFVASNGPGANAELLRHQDFTWIAPVRGICLYGLEVSSSGGETVLYDAEVALRELDPHMRARIDDVVALHYDRFATTRPVQSAAPQVARWPVVLRHPATGRQLLFVNEQTVRELCDVEADEAGPLLASLLAMFDDPGLQYVHRWEVGDVLVWDNIALQHSRRAFPAEQPRNLRRVHFD